MPSLAARVVQAASSQHVRLVFASAGGGHTGAASLLSEPGASSCVLEATSPYSREALLSFVAPEPPPASFASRAAALALGRAALRRAKLLLHLASASGGPVPPTQLRAYGIGSAAALVSATPRRGGHRCFVALCGDDSESVWALHLRGACLDGAGAPSPRTRAEEESICGACVLGAAARAVGLSEEGSASGVRSLLEAAGLGQSGGASADGGAGDDALLIAERRLPSPLSRLLAAAAAIAPPVEAPSSSDAQDAPPPPPPAHVLFTPAALGSSTTLVTADAPISAPTGGCFSSLLLVPGSFAPLHGGHERLAIAASRIAVVAAATIAEKRGFPPPPSPRIIFELSASNVDKPPLSHAEVLSRVAQFVALPSSEELSVAGREVSPPPPVSQPRSVLGTSGICGTLSGASWPVVVTRAARFIEKAALFPGAAFAVGYDTAARLVAPRYYEGGFDDMCLALLRLYVSGTRFYVAGRVAGVGGGTPGCDDPQAFLTVTRNLLGGLPSHLHALFVEVPEDAFREDISSTQLRKGVDAKQ